MSVELKFLNIIVPKSVIAEKYPGGLTQYIRDVPNRSYREDFHFTRVGFMNGLDLEQYLNVLKEKGFHYDKEPEHSDDFVVVDLTKGKWWPASWLNHDLVKCWLHN